MKYFEALYNENRNAVPSWQGYHYQAQIATLHFIETILGYYKKGKNPDKLQLKIEWLEDFIILENDEILEICQVKKTLESSEYKEVLQNFIPQFCLSENDTCIWNIVYSENKVSDLSVALGKIQDIFTENIINTFMNEMNLLYVNVNKPEYWRYNLKLAPCSSDLPHIRYYLRKLLRLNGFEFNKISKEDFKIQFEIDYKNLQDKLIFNAEMERKFRSSLKMKEEKIEKVFENTQKIVEQLCASYIAKSSIVSENDIVGYMYGFVYNQLMTIKHKKTEDLVITYKNIEDIFKCQQKERYIYEKALYEKKIEMDSAIDGKCTRCKNDGTNCEDISYCVLRELLEGDFNSLIADISLELPKYNSNILKNLTDNMTDTKIKYIVSLCDKHKFDKNVNYSNEKRHLIAREAFISALVADPNDDDDIPFNILVNFSDHECIYRDYDTITSKYFEREFSHEDVKIISNHEKYIKNDEDYIPKIKDCLPVKFVLDSKI